MSWIQLKQHFDREAFVTENTMCDVEMAKGISMVIRLIIRWRFVIHTVIKSDTVFDCFRMNACQTYEIPSRVRSDHGLKNVGVARMMLECRGVNRGCITTGGSVRDQRAERPHWDLSSCVPNPIPPGLSLTF